MDFPFPELDEAGYRLWRLRRLILITALIPVIVWFVIGLAFWPFTGDAPSGLFVLFLFAAGLSAIHVVLFPNANAETLGIGLGLAVLSLFEPLIGFSLIARGIELIGFAAIILYGRRVVAAALARLPSRSMSSKAVVVSDRTPEKALSLFAPRPGQEHGRRLCAAADQSGFFAMTLSNPAGFADAAGPEAAPTTVMAKIETTQGDSQTTGIYDVATLGQNVQVMTLVHRATPMADGGAKIVEIETVADVPLGDWFAYWMCDQHQDSLIHLRDGIEGRTTMSLRNAHRESILSVATALLAPKWARLGR